MVQTQLINNIISVVRKHQNVLKHYLFVNLHCKSLFPFLKINKNVLLKFSKQLLFTAK